MNNFKDNLLEIELKKNKDMVTMSWIGQSDKKNPSSVLTPYLNSCIDTLKGSKLTIEFSQLNYINSSTVSPIIEFLKKLNTAGVPTLVTYNTKSIWQSRSFKALRSFSKMLPCLTVQGK